MALNNQQLIALILLFVLVVLIIMGFVWVILFKDKCTSTSDCKTKKKPICFQGKCNEL